MDRQLLPLLPIVELHIIIFHMYLQELPIFLLATKGTKNHQGVQQEGPDHIQRHSTKRQEPE